MKKKYFILPLLLFWTMIGVSQNKADDIVGYYLSLDPITKEKSQSYIYKMSNGTYNGVVCWVENLEKQHFLNYVFLKDLRFDKENNEWIDGKIAHPGMKGKYNAYMKFEGKNNLKVRAYFGVSLFGKTIYWSKESKKRTQKKQ